jgi:hypothetical protein
MVRSLSGRAREKLAGEITALQSRDVGQLKLRWRRLYGREAPARFSRDLLRTGDRLSPAGTGARRA